MTTPYDPHDPDNNSHSPYGSSDANQADGNWGTPGHGTGAGHSYGYAGASQPGAAGGYPDFQPQNDNRRDMKSDGKNFFGALFDFNFDSFVSVKYAKFIYILVVLVAAMYVLFFWVFPFLGLLFSDGEGSAVGAVIWLLFGWIPVGLVTLLMLISTRMFLEFVIASVKTAENTSKLANVHGSVGR